MLVAVLFEASRIVAEAFEARGHDAISVDFRAPDRPGRHWQGDVFDFVRTPDFDRADLVIWHPTCTYVCGSGIHWNKRRPERATLTDQSIEEIERLRAIIKGKRSCMENPVGIIGSRLPLPSGLKGSGKGWAATQHVQPYQYGHDASKLTALRLDGLLPIPTPPREDWFPGRVVEWPAGSGKMVERWGNQTDSGQNALPPSATRWAERSDTYPGIAKAFADNWG